MSVLVYLYIAWFWCDNIFTKLGDVDALPRKYYPELHNWPNSLHITKVMSPKLLLTSNIAKKKEKHGLLNALWTMSPKVI